MAGRHGPLMLRGGGGKPLSRGSRIAVAVAVGVALGCACAFLYPDGLFFRPSASALQWPRHAGKDVHYYDHGSSWLQLRFHGHNMGFLNSITLPVPFPFDRAGLHASTNVGVHSSDVESHYMDESTYPEKHEPSRREVMRIN